MTPPPGLVVRPATWDDQVLALVREAFGAEGDQVAALWRQVGTSDLLRASLVAERDGELVGHVGLSRAWLDARRRLVDVWLLSPLAVRPAHQGRGVGAALLEAAVATARRARTPWLVLEGDPGYYGRHGFEPAAAHGIAPATDRTPAPACQVVRLEAAEDWMSGRVVYPDVWWRHDAAGLRDPQLAQVEQALGLAPTTSTTHQQEESTP
ncbi:putative acetyltransferase [Nocardioides scoriae]|uniref:Putative acetyltransferase n=1 Tax=Nocardioides scoriae TaxID=642780 RepID=A0A1H1Q3H5_9ACTN|nr:N-acetyltransferase [Nocardioides scoriae]SDS17883.1 putative acetyltransferase [Nocardioides scoriae]